MTELETQVSRVREKLQLLVKDYTQLQKENQQLKTELEKIRQQVPMQQDTINQLYEQIEILKISSGNWNEQDKKDFEKRIASYIKEIDKCISMLSK